MIVRDSRTPHGRLESSGRPSSYIAMIDTIGLGDDSASASWRETNHRYHAFLAAARRQGYVKPASPAPPVRPTNVPTHRTGRSPRYSPNKKKRGDHNPSLCRPQIHPKTGPGRCQPCKRDRVNEHRARKRLRDAA